MDRGFRTEVSWKFRGQEVSWTDGTLGSFVDRKLEVSWRSFVDGEVSWTEVSWTDGECVGDRCENCTRNGQTPEGESRTIGW